MTGIDQPGNFFHLKKHDDQLARLGLLAEKYFVDDPNTCLLKLEEQERIVLKVDALFQLADRIEARYTAARPQAQRLSPLFLAKAFRGELVPQDPKDEPASALLKRIHAAKPEPSPKSRRGRLSKVPHCDS